jgi:hypothetical protein
MFHKHLLFYIHVLVFIHFLNLTLEVVDFDDVKRNVKRKFSYWRNVHFRIASIRFTVYRLYEPFAHNICAWDNFYNVTCRQIIFPVAR